MIKCTRGTLITFSDGENRITFFFVLAVLFVYFVVCVLCFCVLYMCFLLCRAWIKPNLMLLNQWKAVFFSSSIYRDSIWKKWDGTVQGEHNCLNFCVNTEQRFFFVHIGILACKYQSFWKLSQFLLWLFLF